MPDDEMNLDWELIHDLRQMIKAGVDVPQLVDEIRQRLQVSRQLTVPIDSPFIPILYFVKAFHIRITEAKDLGCWSRYLAGTYTNEQVNDTVKPYILRQQSVWANRHAVEATNNGTTRRYTRPPTQKSPLRVGCNQFLRAA